MNFRSHTKNSILKALSENRPVYKLDTGTSGEDDMLIGLEVEVRSEIMDYHNITEWPEYWTLARVLDV